MSQQLKKDKAAFEDSKVAFFFVGQSIGLILKAMLVNCADKKTGVRIMYYLFLARNEANKTATLISAMVPPGAESI